MAQMRIPTTTGMSSQIPIGGGSLRGGGWFFFIIGILGLIITTPIYYFQSAIASSFSGFSFPFFTAVGLIALWICLIVVGFILAGLYILPEWIRVPALRLGRYKSMRGPGVFWLTPFIYSIPFALDIRIITTIFSAEQTLTADNVPVNVDAVLFWQVMDPFQASIKVQDYKNAILWAAQTSLRDIIGKTDLNHMLVGREQISQELQATIDARTETWGVQSISTEIRDVVIPTALQDAMSRQAQAERERQARIILASSEEQIAERFVNAAKIYEKDQVAFNLRAMNILYESMKEKGAWIIVPSEMVKLLSGSLQTLGGRPDE